VCIAARDNARLNHALLKSVERRVRLTDIQKPSDIAKPLKPRELAEKARAQIEQLTRRLERQGVEREKATLIAERIAASAEGPVAHDDWMTLEADRFKPETRTALEREGLTHDVVLSDPDKAEVYTGRVFALEGIPDGNGGTEKVRDVVPGHFDQAEHGIDLVAADAEGVPIPIEVKKYEQPSAAELADSSVVKSEPEVEQWRTQREAQVLAKQRGALTDIRPDAEATWKPEVKEWRRQIAWDGVRMDEYKGELPVQQMDDLWVRDRWLKLIKTPEGQSRLSRIGVDEKYLDYQRLRTSPDLPEWQAILDRRTTVIVSGSEGDAGRRLFLQATAEGRSKRVVKIEV